jgi:uncharacterized protein (DUF2062 family)
MKLNYLNLIRSKDGAHKVARGFAVGFGLEMIIPYSFYTLYVLFIPFVFLFRASMSTAIIGNVIGKFSFLPIFFIPLALKIGHLIGFPQLSFIHHKLHIYLEGIVGFTVVAILVGLISYIIVYAGYESNRKYRIKKRHEKHHQAKKETIA